MAETLKLGNGEWATKENSLLSYNDENGNYKPLPFDFTRASSATVVNKAGLIETVGTGIPRIDFLGNTNGALLLEPQRTNLITYSNDFTNSGWSHFRGTITANAIISPDGTLNASRYQEDSQTGSHMFRRQSLSITNGLSYTGSIFAKKGELTSIILQSNSSSRWVASATFDLENGTVTSGTGVIENYGNGWYKCSISGNAVQTTADAGLEILTSSSVGRNGDGLYMYGAEFEQSSYPTSYIPTQGSTVTRVAEICTGAGNDQVINSTEGVLYAEIEGFTNGGQGDIYLTMSDGSSVNSIQLLLHNTANRINFRVRSANVLEVNISDLTFNQDTNNKIACLYSSGKFSLWINGIEGVSTVSGNVPSNLSVLNFTSTGTSNPFYGKVRDVKVFDTALTDAELQALTTI